MSKCTLTVTCGTKASSCQFDSIRQYFKQISAIAWQTTSSLFIPLFFYRFYCFFLPICQKTSIDLSNVHAHDIRERKSRLQCARSDYLCKRGIGGWCNKLKSITEKSSITCSVDIHKIVKHVNLSQSDGEVKKFSNKLSIVYAPASRQRWSRQTVDKVFFEATRAIDNSSISCSRVLASE